MKNLKKLGKVLSSKEQKSVNGGKMKRREEDLCMDYNFCSSLAAQDAGGECVECFSFGGETTYKYVNNNPF